ncbi:hypothetical protein FOCC_FOCC007794 [Frankliniella occidentalis]|nr:hypothetical protein FOCC_FOCC007794 [Frankliniella occidentalis]
MDCNNQQDCSNVNHSIDIIDQGHIVAENHDNIVFAGSNNRSPWKVAPLNVSEEQFKQVNIELSHYKNEVRRLKEQSQAAELVFKQAEEDLKLKLHDTEEDFKIKVEKTEENYKVQLGKAEEEFRLNLEKVTEDFKLKLQQLEADFQLKLKRTQDHFTLQLQKLSCKVNEQENKIKSHSENLDLYSKISAALKTEKSLYKKQLKEAEEKHLFKNFITEENIGHYTGLPNLGTFHWLLSMVPAQLNYYFGSNVKCLSREDQLFITLFKLRRNVSHQLLADRFKVSLFTISNIVITWVSALEIILVEGIMNKNVPSLQKVRRSMPEVFNMYPNCGMIFDCTEVEVEVPSLMSNQNEVYSSYKNRTNKNNVDKICWCHC